MTPDVAVALREALELMGESTAGVSSVLRTMHEAYSEIHNLLAAEIERLSREQAELRDELHSLSVTFLTNSPKLLRGLPALGRDRDTEGEKP